MRRAIRPSPASSTGRRNILAIFTKFAGEAPQDSLAPAYAHRLFDSDLPGSFSHFYSAMSFGALEIRGASLSEVYSSDHPPSFYLVEDSNIGRFGEFNLEILRKVDADVDFGAYDNDGPDGIPNSGDDDGYVDIVFINLRSIPKNFLMGTATGVGNLGFEDDFITDDPANPSGYIKIRGNGNPEGPGGTTQMVRSFAHAVGSMAHEYGHILGLPDLLDRSFSFDSDPPPEMDSAGIGRWGLMGHGALGWNDDDGPNPFCAWSREQLGWIGQNNENLVVVTEDLDDVLIDDVEVGGKVYKIPVNEREYFLVENRQPSGGYYDRNIPKGGLLIWHISLGSSNSMEERKRVDLECADGLFDDKGYPDGVLPNPHSGRDNLDFWAHDETYRERHRGNLGDATDIFDGESFISFSRDANPSSSDYAGDFRNGSKGIAVTNIRRSGSSMIADFVTNKWSGHISTRAIWSGVIQVTGDITIDPGATLSIRGGTVVKFAAADDQKGGADPLRCELNVYGRLSIQGTSSAPVLFVSVAEDPGEDDWYGISLDPGSASVDISHLTVENSEFGIFWSGQPAIVEVEAYTVFDHRIITPWAPYLSTLGNGDSLANPGELLSLGIGLKNWTFRRISPLIVRPSTDDPYVNPHGIFQLSEIRSFGEGVGSEDVASNIPHLRFMISSECPDGHVIPIALEITDGMEVWEDTLEVSVVGSDRTPPFIASLSVSPKYAPASDRFRIEAEVWEGGSLSSVTAEIVRAGDSTVIDSVPLQDDGRGEDSAAGDMIFTGTWLPTFESDYYIRISAVDLYGNLEKTGALAGMTSKPFVRSADILLLDHIPPGEQDKAGDALKASGLRYDLWNSYYRGSPDHTDISRYAGSTVIWLSSPDSSGQEFLKAHLERGGRLFISDEGLGYNLSRSTPSQSFLNDYLRAEVYDIGLKGSLTGVEGDPITDGLKVDELLSFSAKEVQKFLPKCSCGAGGEATPESKLALRIDPLAFGEVLNFLILGFTCGCGCNGFNADNKLSFRDLISPLSQAEPIFVDASGSPTALRIDTGIFKAVYLGFRFQSIGDADQRIALVSRAINWLLSSPTSVQEDMESLPRFYELSLNYPNPFNFETVVQYQLPQMSHVEINILNSLGQKLTSLVHADQPAGRYRVRWDGRDEYGRELASGIYFIRMLSKKESEEFTKTKKILLLR